MQNWPFIVVQNYIEFSLAMWENLFATWEEALNVWL